jgi:hypothetical protein
MALCSMSGKNGYATQNMYNVLEGNNDTNKDTVTIITQTVAATTTTSTTPWVRPTINADITTAITQLVANQMAIMLQIAATLFAQGPAQHTCQYVQRSMFQVPPIQQVAIPMQEHFPAGNFNAGCGGRQGNRGRGRSCSRWGNTPLADYMQTAGAVQSVTGQLIHYGEGMAQIPPPPSVRNLESSNVYKWYNNWNVCFLCGFDIENNHTSTTCPFCKMNHQQAYACKNAQQLIAAGYDPCTMKKQEKLFFCGERGPMRLLPPILVHNFFQLQK